MSVTERLYHTEILARLLRRRRRERVQFWLSKVATSEGMRILDVGCGPDGRSIDDWLDPSYQIDGVDLHKPSDVRHSHPRFTYHEQDATDLSRFGDQVFDLAFCIGVMEHITNHDKLTAIAGEIMRTSRQWVVMVPYHYAWIEPHFKVPFFQLLPYGAQLSLVKVLDLHNLRDRVRTDPTHLRTHYQWLTNEEWLHIFPDSRVFLMPTREAIAIIRSDRE